MKKPAGGWGFWFGSLLFSIAGFLLLFMGRPDISSSRGHIEIVDRFVGLGFGCLGLIVAFLCWKYSDDA